MQAASDEFDLVQWLAGGCVGLILYIGKVHRDIHNENRESNKRKDELIARLMTKRRSDDAC